MKKFFVFSLLTISTLSGCFGGSSSQSVTLYVSDTDFNTINVWNNAQKIMGNLAPDRVIGGTSNANFSGAYDISYDKNTDSLYVGDRDSDSVKIYDGVKSVDGDIAPDRILTGASTLITGGNAYENTVDSQRDLLYVAYTDGILVFESASTLDGNVAPVHNITGANTGFASRNDKRLFIDEANDRLYVCDLGAKTIMVFDNASTVDGNVTPDRTITSASFDGPWGITVDLKRDIMYISDEPISKVYIFDNASTINGSVTPDRTLTGTNTDIDWVENIAIDSARNELYVSHWNITDGLAAVSVWVNASSVDGDIAPSRSITGDQTQLSEPESFFLVGI